MGQECMVSVIMLAYNCEEHITQAIESVAAQEVDFPYEILIGNDASTDATAQRIREAAQRHPQILPVDRETNTGAAYNAYDLLMRSRGKYLAFCEGDDYWIDPHKLQRQVRFLESHPEYIGCAHRCLLVDDAGAPLRRQKLPWVKARRRFTFRDFSGGRFLPGQTATVVKRNLFRDSDEDWSILYSSNRNISDRISNALYLLRGDFYCSPEVLTAYRKRSFHSGKNLTSVAFKDNANKCEDELQMNEAMERYASDYLGKPVRFSRKRADILLDAFLEAARYRDEEHRAFLRRFLRSSRLAEFLLLPASAAGKLYRHFLH